MAGASLLTCLVECSDQFHFATLMFCNLIKVSISKGKSFDIESSSIIHFSIVMLGKYKKVYFTLHYKKTGFQFITDIDGFLSEAWS